MLLSLGYSSSSILFYWSSAALALCVLCRRKSAKYIESYIAKIRGTFDTRLSQTEVSILRRNHAEDDLISGSWMITHYLEVNLPWLSAEEVL